MKESGYYIDSYRIQYENALLDLEHFTPQGKGVQFEMVRPQFLSRSKIFDNYSVFVALDKLKTEIIGVSAVSIVPVRILNRISNVGFGYDLKVHPSHQNQGIAKEFAKCLVDIYLANNGIKEYFTTFKASNQSMTKVVNFIQRKWYNYNFFYLTIPTFKRVNSSTLESGDQFLSIEMFGDSEKLKSYIIQTESGIKIWKTYSTYQLKIKEMQWILGVGAKFLNQFRAKSKGIPVKGDVIKFATLYDFDQSKIGSVNDALELLQKKGIQFLNVCCTKNDFCYKLFKPIAINELPYSLLNTFGVSDNQKFSIDVRCL